MDDNKFQLAIHEVMKAHDENMVGVGVAGCGKTRTLVRGLEKSSPFYNVLLGAFDNSTKDEFIRRTKHLPYVRAINYNGFGWGICCNNVKGVRLDGDKTENTLEFVTMKPTTEDDRKIFSKIKGTYKRLVSICKNRGLTDMQDVIEGLPEIYDHYGILPVADQDLFLRTYYHIINNTTVMDFDDQKFMPVKYGWDVPTYDTVVMDEFQDTCEIEFMLLQRAIENGGRFVCFGDPDQSIYGFKGTDPEFFKVYTETMGCRSMPLSICYRCPVSVIHEAQKFVPRILPAPDAIEGSVDTVNTDVFVRGVRPGDFVLCRTSAPLIKRCLEGIGNKVPGKVRGRDLGDKIEYLVETVCTGDHSMSIKEFTTRLLDYRTTQCGRLISLRQEKSAEQLDDRCESTMAVAKAADSVQDLFRILKEVFTRNDKESHNGVDYMTIHKSKGLQAKNVWILRPDLLPHPKAKKPWMQDEERRLQYVGVTRCEENLRYVRKEQGER